MHGDRMPSPVQGIKNREETKAERVPNLEGPDVFAQFMQPVCILQLDGYSIDRRACLGTNDG
jgi:hypothetical protein